MANRLPVSPFGRVGGKQRIASKIVPFIPPHSVYIEPFAGAAAVFFLKPRVNALMYAEVLNDSDYLIVNVYRVLQDKCKTEELLRLLSFTPYSHAEFLRAYDIYIEGRESSCSPPSLGGSGDVLLAWAFLVVTGQSPGYLMSRSWAVSPGSSNSRQQKSVDFAGLPARLLLFLDRLRLVTIECTDFLACLKKWDSPSAFFYCDPPYVGISGLPYPGFSQSDFEQLIDFLAACEGSFLLSTYENAAIPAAWERYEILASCSIAGVARTSTVTTAERRRVELLFRVDRSSAMKAPALYAPGARSLLLDGLRHTACVRHP